MNEQKNILWRLLLQALVIGRDNRLLTVREAPEIEEYIDNNFDVLDGAVLPAKFSSSPKIYRFLLGGREYRVCFCDEAPIGKDAEYFGRGSVFIRDLLNTIFGTYNLLLVNNIKYGDEVDIDISRFLEAENVTLAAQEDVKSEEEGENYRYRVGLWVTVKDRIDKKVTSKTIPVSLSVEFDGGRYRYDEKQVDFSDARNEQSDYIDAYPDDEISGEDRKALAKLAERLQDKEEKERIFRQLAETRGNDVSAYIALRDAHARDAGDRNPIYRYNLTALTVYLDRVQHKKYTYSLTGGGLSAQYSVVFNPTKGLSQVECPVCKAKVGGGADKLLLARGKDGGIVACKRCCERVENECYRGAAAGWFLKRDLVDAYFEKPGKKLRALAEDTYVNLLDGERYLKITGFVPKGYFLRGKLSMEPAGRLFPRERKYVCGNCNAAYAVAQGEEETFQKTALVRAADSGAVGCVDCCDKPSSADRPLKRILYRSDVGELFFTERENARRCFSCDNIVYRDQLTPCALCGRSVCPDCLRGDLCKDCAACMGSGVQSGEAKKLWSYFKAALPLSYRRKKHCVYARKDAEGNELYYVEFPVSKKVFCFEKADGVYVLLNARNG